MCEGVASTSGPIQTAARHVNPPALQQSSSPLSFNNHPSPPVLEPGGEEVARREAAEPQKPSSSPATRATDDVPSEHALKKRVAIAAENVQDANVSIPIIPKSSATLQLLGEHLTATPEPRSGTPVQLHVGSQCHAVTVSFFSIPRFL